MLKLILRLCVYILIWGITEKIIKVNCPAEAWATIFVGFEAAFIGLTQLKNTRNSLEVTLFMQFNERYSKLNENVKDCFEKKLCEIEMSDRDQSKLLKKTLEDYINLCCEEYYCYRVKKQIPFRIWKFWHAGIMYNWNNCQCLEEFWGKEYSNANSFYISDGDYPFKMEAIKKNKSSILFCFEKIESFFY